MIVKHFRLPNSGAILIAITNMPKLSMDWVIISRKDPINSNQRTFKLWKMRHSGAQTIRIRMIRDVFPAEVAVNSQLAVNARHSSVTAKIIDFYQVLVLLLLLALHPFSEF